MAPLLLVLASLALLVAAYLVFGAERARLWSRLAARHGWSYLAREPGLGRFGRFRACRTGAEHAISHRACGQLDGMRVDVAELVHSERDFHDPRKIRTTVQTACLVEAPALRLPAFHARPRRLLDELGRLAQIPDIAFDEDPAFSQAFVLQGEDVPAIRARFDEPSRRWLSERARQGFTFEGVGDALLVLSPRSLGRVGHETLLRVALDLARRWSTP